MKLQMLDFAVGDSFFNLDIILGQVMFSCRLYLRTFFSTWRLTKILTRLQLYLLLYEIKKLFDKKKKKKNSLKKTKKNEKVVKLQSIHLGNKWLKLQYRYNYEITPRTLIMSTKVKIGFNVIPILTLNKWQLYNFRV